MNEYPTGKLVFTDRQGNILADYSELPHISHNDNPVEWLDAQTPNLNIDANTRVSETTASERTDWHLAVGHLFTEDNPGQPHI